MRLAFVGSRTNYYDRNLAAISKSFSGTVGPHGSTTRFTYTVPTARKALITSISANLVRKTAAAPVGEVIASFQATSSVILKCPLFKNAIADDVQIAIGPNHALLAGDTYTCTTFDGGTGGTVWFELASAIDEFDAI